MKIEISLLIAIGGVFLSAITVYIAIKKNTKIDVEEQAKKVANEKIIQFQLDELKEDVKKILSKLDKQELEIKRMIKEEMDHHIEVYHKEGLK